MVPPRFTPTAVTSQKQLPTTQNSTTHNKQLLQSLVRELLLPTLIAMFRGGGRGGRGDGGGRSPGGRGGFGGRSPGGRGGGR